MQNSPAIIDMEPIPERRAKGINPKPIRLLSDLRLHWKMATVLFSGCLLLGLTVVWFKFPPLYETKAEILIEPVLPKVLYNQDNTSIAPYYDDFVRTQINIIKSYPILTRSLAQFAEKGFDWRLPGENFREAVSRLINHLEVSQIRDTQLVTISLTSASNHGLSTLVNSIAATYMEGLKDKQSSTDSSRLKFLQDRQKQLEEELRQMYVELGEAANSQSIGSTDEKNIYVYLQAVVEVQNTLMRAKMDESEWKVKLGELEDRLKTLQIVDISAEVDQWVENDPAIQDNRIQMSRKLQNMRIALAGMKENHPERVEFEKSFEKLVEVQNRMRSRARIKAESVIRGKLIADHNLKIQEAKTEYSARKKNVERLIQEVRLSEEKASQVNNEMTRAVTSRKDIKRIQDSLLMINERIDQLEVESWAPGRIYIVNRAIRPEVPTAGKRKKMLVLVLLFSSFVSVGYAVGREKLDHRVWTTADVERIIGRQPTGYILDVNQLSDKTLNPQTAALDDPTSALAEQYKRMALSFIREQEQYQSRIFTGFSLYSGEGTTSILSNILCTLTQRRDQKLYVDLNIKNPKTKLPSGKNVRGLWEVLEGDCSLEDVIVRESRLPFHILPLGNWETNGDSLYQEMGLDALLHSLRMDYKCVMIDSPPFYSSTDSKYLAKISDVTILVLQAGTTTDEQLYQVVQELDEMQIKVISMILNRAVLSREGAWGREKESFMTPRKPPEKPYQKNLA